MGVNPAFLTAFGLDDLLSRLGLGARLARSAPVDFPHLFRLPLLVRIVNSLFRVWCSEARDASPLGEDFPGSRIA
jgi:hypothetical protein